MNEQSPRNTVQLMPEGYIEVRLIGEQNFKKIEDIGKDARPIINRLNYTGKPILGLIDFTEDKSFNTGSNKAALQVLEGIPYRRAAMFGTNPVMVAIGKTLIVALGKSENTRVFGSRDEALAWLMNEPMVPSAS